MTFDDLPQSRFSFLDARTRTRRGERSPQPMGVSPGDGADISVRGGLA